MAVLARDQYTITDLSDPIQQGAPPAAPVVGLLWLDTSEAPPMLRRWDGVNWVAVGDLTDEIMDEVLMQLAEYESRLETTSHSIMSEVSAKYATTGNLDTISKQLSTLSTQSSSNYTWTVNQIAALQNESINNNGQLVTQMQQIMSYMTFDETGLTIGKSGNPMKMKITNDRVSILQNLDEIAYFSSNRLYVKSGEFLTTMKLGNFEFVPQTNGNLSFVKAV